VRQQLTGAKTQIDRASEIVGDMSDRVRGHLEEIAALVRAAEEGADAAAATAQDGVYATAPDGAEGQ
jgi:hypothetical protein